MLFRSFISLFPSHDKRGYGIGRAIYDYVDNVFGKIEKSISQSREGKSLWENNEILLAQDGGVDVSYSDQATLVDGATTHHLWQENKFAVRVEKFITWAKRRPIAAAFLDYA